jgi:hypothetical protein
VQMVPAGSPRRGDHDGGDLVAGDLAVVELRAVSALLDSERLTRGTRLTRGPACLSLCALACVVHRVHLAVQRLDLKRIFGNDFSENV